MFNKNLYVHVAPELRASCAALATMAGRRGQEISKVPQLSIVDEFLIKIMLMWI
jgi:hypothetical protein